MKPTKEPKNISMTVLRIQLHTRALTLKYELKENKWFRNKHAICMVKWFCNF